MLPLLESGMKPVAGQRYRLVETFSDVQVIDDPYTVIPSIDESTGMQVLTERRIGEGLMQLRGVFQRSDVKNANKRTYPRKIWEKWLDEKSSLMTKITQHQCCGQIEHPKDGVGTMEDYAVKVTGLTLESNGTVIGEMSVLDTPKGRIVRDLIRSKVRPGVSSRGTGSVDANGVVDERTFVPETWDIVGNPSTPGAFPEVVEDTTATRRNAVAESKSHPHKVRTLIEDGKPIWEVSDSSGTVVRRYTANIKLTQPGDRRMNPKDRFGELRKQVTALTAQNLSETAGKATGLDQLDDALAGMSIAAGQLVQEDATLSAVVGDLQLQISEKRTAIRAKANECDNDDEDDEDDDEDDEDDDADESATTADASPVDPANVKEAIDCLLAARTNITELESKVAAQEAAITQLAEEVAEREVELGEAYESLAASTAMLAEMTSTESFQQAPLAEAIEEAIAATPALEKHRKSLTRCESVEEVQTLAESLTPRGAAPATSGGTVRGLPRMSESLPPIGGGRDSLNEQREPRGTELSRYNQSGGSGAIVPRGVSLCEKAIRATHNRHVPTVNTNG